jgi:hypothetical protein
MEKAIQYLERIHELSLLHRDVHQFRVSTLRNVMLLKNGDVKWIDFEHSMLGASVEELEFEMRIAKETIGPQGLLWRRRYVFWLSMTRVCPIMRKKLPALIVTKAIHTREYIGT